MPSLSASELKKALIAEGFEIYRTAGNRVQLADRVRDNLIMDSGVAALIGDSLGVRFVVRAQASDFQGESEQELFNRARRLAEDAVEQGYREIDTAVVTIRDPGDESRTLDTWYEVAFTKAVASLDQLYSELRFAFSLEKAASKAQRT
jgi:hypothetical protein